MDNSPDSVQDGKSHGINILIGLSFCVFLYFALSGPAVRAHQSPACPDPIKKGIFLLYNPLAELDQKIPGRPFEKYVSLWIKK
jgi:hypothetical protein